MNPSNLLGLLLFGRTRGRSIVSRADAVKVKVIAELRQAGLSFELLERASAGLGNCPAAMTHGAMLLVNGTVKVVDPQHVLEAIEGETLTLVSAGRGWRTKRVATPRTGT